MTIPASWSPTWNITGLTLQFAPGRGIVMQGSLSTNNVTFTAANTTQGWSGIRFEPGSGGTIASSVIERVRGYGGAALTITGASPTIRGTEIRDSPCCGVTGIALNSVYGNGANPLLERNTITQMSGNGITVDSYSQPRLIRNVIADNSGAGVVAGYQTTVFLAPEAATGGRRGNDILRNATGVSASGSAYVNYAWYFYGSGGYHNDGYNNVTDNRANGNVATSNAAIAAGNSSNLRRNGFYRNAANVAGGLDVQATGSGTRAYVDCNYWGPGAAPPFRTAATGGATLYNASYLVSDPRAPGHELDPCVPIGSRAARGGASSTNATESSLSVLADAASMADPYEALAALSGIVARGGPLVAAGLAQVGQIARRPDAPAEAFRMLDAYAAGSDGAARRAQRSRRSSACAARPATPRARSERPRRSSRRATARRCSTDRRRGRTS